MDDLIRQGQWWWLLVPLGTGLFALIGSWVGSTLGKATEHWQWLRNEKQKEYVAAVGSLSAAVDALAALIQEKPARDVPEDSSFITPVNVLGPNRVKKAMRTVMSDIQACLSILSQQQSEKRTADAQAAHDILVKNYDSFVEAVRRDLGVKD
ncbi:hypothetical protein [Arthrobacter sp. ISL-28]|uniref:hypothetical protein n=1 Tax=Arthrobacter sp. ISL-28 TaxID=2819108 RepID=UPI001BEBF684|nr:hypothetical protein [Arthrobacter sp. ISL-28]MBT2522758.1 hypothetical protein [Arthrobacter sp. ISL-28]